MSTMHTHHSSLSHPLLYTLSFATNFFILAFEIAGGRVLAPYLGTSVGVWAGLIAVILGAMAIGYHFGGEFADRDASPKRIGLIVLASSGTALIAWSMRDLAPLWFPSAENAITVQAVFVGLILFMPTVALLAAVSPMLAKNLITRLDTSAKAVGRLNAVGTLGSILGALATGLFLIPNFGVGEILLAIPIMLCVLSLPLTWRGLKKYVLYALVCIVVALAVNAIPTHADEVIADVSTPYHRIFVHRLGNGSVLGMSDSPWGVQCAMKIQGDGGIDESDVSFSYLSLFDLATKHFFPEQIDRALFLGGCVQVFPRFILTHYPHTVADSVEIDPGVTEVARTYFGFRDENFPALTIHHEDARTFINREPSTLYNLIVVDAFGSSGRAPFHLVTKEMFERLARSTASDGMVIMNTHGSYEGDGLIYPSALVRTAKEAFRHVSLYRFRDTPQNGQNMVLVASQNTELPERISIPEYSKITLTRVTTRDDVIVLTDNYAPVELVWRNRLLLPYQ
ncbi:fused MFS/spermidine synthase [Patescibacteria group bacterium]|nr:fused MFS/spermidine synthase [Patescibacteria group bacterium]